MAPHPSSPVAKGQPLGGSVLYLDTSALTKLYVEEPGSKELTGWIATPPAEGDPAVQLYTSRLGIPETVSAITRRRNVGTLSSKSILKLWHRVVSDFAAPNPRYAVIDASEVVVGRAAWLVAQHGLRAYDAVHLASALWLRPRLGDPDALVFVSADKRLSKVAAAERLTTVDPTPAGPAPIE